MNSLSKTVRTLILGVLIASASLGAQAQDTRRVPADSAAGSAGSDSATSLSDRAGSGARSDTRASDEPYQLEHLAPYALGLFLLMAGGLYWLVFRKPTSAAGEVAAENEARENREIEVR